MIKQKQGLLWAGEWERVGNKMRAKPIPCPREPNKVWTLFKSLDQRFPPPLPIRPQHRTNAFVEVKYEDWVWRNGQLHYWSYMADCPVWLLLIFEEHIYSTKGISYEERSDVP